MHGYLLHHGRQQAQAVCSALQAMLSWPRALDLATFAWALHLGCGGLGVHIPLRMVLARRRRLVGVASAPVKEKATFIIINHHHNQPPQAIAIALPTWGWWAGGAVVEGASDADRLQYER